MWTAPKGMHMQSLTRTVAAGIAAAALLIGATGCSKPDEGTPGPVPSAASDTTGAPEAGSAPGTDTAAPSTPAAKPAGYPTLADYVRSAGLAATPLRHGDPGPTVKLPDSEGWELTYDLPEAPFGALVLQHPVSAKVPARVVMVMTRLTGGPVDRDAVFAATGNEIRALPNFQGPATGQSSRLSGYVADQVGGLYQEDGQLIAQKTVLIPGRDGSYVLQVRASGSNEDAAALMTITGELDDETVITA